MALQCKCKCQYDGIIWRSIRLKYERMQEITVESYPKTNEESKDLPRLKDFFFSFFLFIILRRYRFLIYKFTNSTMNVTVLFSSLPMLPPFSRTYFVLIQCVHISRIVQKITSLQISFRYVALRRA